MIEPLILRSLRLHLRRLCMEDVAPIAAYRSLPEVALFQSWESFSLADAAQLVGDQAAVVPDTPGTWLQFALVLSESAKVIGDCGIHFRGDDPRQVELGITLSPIYQGRGLAAEALTRVLEYIFDQLGKHRVSAITDAENRAAASLFLHLGFRRESHNVEHVWFKGAWGSEYLFALLNREWQGRQTNNCDALPHNCRDAEALRSGARGDALRHEDCDSSLRSASQVEHARHFGSEEQNLRRIVHPDEQHDERAGGTERGTDGGAAHVEADQRFAQQEQ